MKDSDINDISNEVPLDEFEICVQTFGSFRLWVNKKEVSSKDWKRDKALQMFQLFITQRKNSHQLHKEQIIDTLWPEKDLKSAAQNFKVNLHALNNTLEPDKESRSEARYIIKVNQQFYRLKQNAFWIDADLFESSVQTGNEYYLKEDPKSIEEYLKAIHLYQGDYLIDRIYEDWCSDERERLLLLYFGVLSNLSKLLLDKNPLESIRLTQLILKKDPLWEEAYRIQMNAYIKQGNRPLAIRTFNKCKEKLDHELGIEPLPQTIDLYKQISNL